MTQRSNKPSKNRITPEKGRIFGSQPISLFGKTAVRGANTMSRSASSNSNTKKQPLTREQMRFEDQGPLSNEEYLVHKASRGLMAKAALAGMQADLMEQDHIERFVQVTEYDHDHMADVIPLHTTLPLPDQAQETAPHQIAA